MKNGKPIDITTGWINVNTNCNSRCKWCYLTEEVANPIQPLSIGKALQVADFYADLNIISCILIGGEPTLYPDLIPLVARLKNNQIPEVTVVTNGRRLYDLKYTEALATAGLDIFSVTIHSARKELHDLISKRKAFDHASQGVRNVISLGKECSINLVVNEDNISDVPNSILVFLDWGVSQVIVSCANPAITSDGVNGSESLDPKRFVELIEKLMDFPREVVILHELPVCMIPRTVLLKLMEQQRLGFGCHIGVGAGIVVDVNGHIIPCNSFSGHRIMELFDGDKIRYTRDEFLKVWSTDQSLKMFRQQANVYRTDLCSQCELWQICNSGCPIVWGHYDPEEYIKGGLDGITLEQVLNLMKGGEQIGGEEGTLVL